MFTCVCETCLLTLFISILENVPDHSWWREEILPLQIHTLLLKLQDSCKAGQSRHYITSQKHLSAKRLDPAGLSISFSWDFGGENLKKRCFWHWNLKQRRYKSGVLTPIFSLHLSQCGEEKIVGKNEEGHLADLVVSPWTSCVGFSCIIENLLLWCLSHIAYLLPLEMKKYNIFIDLLMQTLPPWVFEIFGFSLAIHTHLAYHPTI